MSALPVIVVLGASSVAGRQLIERTRDAGVQLIGVSRRQPRVTWPHVTWMQHDLATGPAPANASTVVSLGPLNLAWRQVEAGHGLGRVIALAPARPAAVSEAEAAAERLLVDHCRQHAVDLTVLRPTQVYGSGCDGGLRRTLVRWRRPGVVACAGSGLRQPVHADDLAALILECLALGSRSRGDWLLGGGETLRYPDMVRRALAAGGERVRLVKMPAWLLRLAVRLVPGRTRTVTPAMIARQRLDWVVDDQPARTHLGWNPGPYRPA